MDKSIPHIAAFGFRALNGVDGGIETHARELYPRLANLGFRITVLSRMQFQQQNRTSVSIDEAAPNLTSKPLYAPTTRGLEALIHSAIAAGYCVFQRPDVVHVHGIGPSLFIPILRLFGLRIVMTHHGPDYDATKWRWFGRAVLQIGEGLGVRSANAVICVSNYIRDLIRRKYRVDAHTIYNGLPNSQSIEPPRDRHLRSLETRRYVLMVGRLTPHKRIEDVIAAMTDRDLADIELVVCGSGSERDLYVQHLRNLARQQRNVKLLGFVSPEDLPWVYANSLCTVMASSYEGMPLAVLEALSFGSPTVLSRIPAHEELKLPAIQYFDLGNVEGIRACIHHVREQPPDTRSMAATTIDDRFDWDTIAAQTQSVFLQTIESATSDKKAVH